MSGPAKLHETLFDFYTYTTSKEADQQLRLEDIQPVLMLSGSKLPQFPKKREK